MTESSPRYLTPSKVREQHLKRIKDLEKQLADKSEQVLGKRAHLVFAGELEFAAVSKGYADAYPQNLMGEGNKKVISAILPQSPFIARFDGSEPIFEGATEETPDGRWAKLLEAVISHREKNKYLPAEGRDAPVIRFAQFLEFLPKYITAKASELGLERVDIVSVPFRGDKDQPASCHIHMNLVGDDGKNLYDDGNNLASPFHICCINELLKFEENGGLALYVPTEDAYKKLLRNECIATMGGHGTTLRRIPHGTGTIFIRGPNYNVAHIGDTRKHKIKDEGGVRTEHRLPCPEAITLAPDQSPYLMIESYLLQHIKALDTFSKLSDAEKAALTPESLWEKPLEPFPRTFAQAKRDFETSTYLHEFYPELQQQTLAVINSGQKAAALR